MSRQSLRDEGGSGDAIFAAVLFPTLAIMFLGLVMTFLVRASEEAPLPSIAAAAAQQFAAYGSDYIPVYGRPTPESPDTVSEAVIEQVLATPGANPDGNIELVCGPLLPTGEIQDVMGIRTPNIPANTIVGCDLTVELKGWPYRSIVPGGVPELLLGGEWKGRATAYTDRGSNANLR